MKDSLLIPELTRQQERQETCQTTRRFQYEFPRFVLEEAKTEATDSRISLCLPSLSLMSLRELRLCCEKNLRMKKTEEEYETDSPNFLPKRQHNFLFRKILQWMWRKSRVAQLSYSKKVLREHSIQSRREREFDINNDIDNDAIDDINKQTEAYFSYMSQQLLPFIDVRESCVLNHISKQQTPVDWLFSRLWTQPNIRQKQQTLKAVIKLKSGRTYMLWSMGDNNTSLEGILQSDNTTCSNTTRFFMERMTPHELEFLDSVYRYICPPLIFSSLISFFLNACLFAIGHKYTHNKTPVLILSLNLASTDTAASLLTGIGILCNSYLPHVYGVHLSTCLFLGYEIVRLSALIASALHLLGLAYIHYKGTVNPLHYRWEIRFN